MDYDYGKLIIGDFDVKVGMGNIMGESINFSKGADVIQPTINYKNNLKPYTSKMDYRLMRGATTRITLPLFSNIDFASTL
jgi:hypothetical protein